MNEHPTPYDYKHSRIVIRTLIKEDANPFNMKLDSPENAAQYWRDVIEAEPDHECGKENLIVICVNSKLYPTSWNRVSIGSLNETTADIRAILTPPLVTNSYGFILMHNHPSGDPEPSRADICLTRRLKEAAEIMRIQFCDHVIRGDEKIKGYYSLREHGII